MVSFQAAWVTTSTRENISSVQTYPLDTTGMRVEIALTGASHNCGNGASVFYYDSNKIPMETVKSSMSVALSAMMAGKSVNVTYDCSLGSGGFGWGVGVTTFN